MSEGKIEIVEKLIVRYIVGGTGDVKVLRGSEACGGVSDEFSGDREELRPLGPGVERVAR